MLVGRINANRDVHGGHGLCAQVADDATSRLPFFPNVYNARVGKVQCGRVVINNLDQRDSIEEIYGRLKYAIVRLHYMVNLVLQVVVVDLVVDGKQSNGLSNVPVCGRERQFSLWKNPYLCRLVGSVYQGGLRSHFHVVRGLCVQSETVAGVFTLYVAERSNEFDAEIVGALDFVKHPYFEIRFVVVYNVDRHCPRGRAFVLNVRGRHVMDHFALVRNLIYALVDVVAFRRHVDLVLMIVWIKRVVLRNYDDFWRNITRQTAVRVFDAQVYGYFIQGRQVFRKPNLIFFPPPLFDTLIDGGYVHQLPGRVYFVTECLVL